MPPSYIPVRGHGRLGPGPSPSGATHSAGSGSYFREVGRRFSSRLCNPAFSASNAFRLTHAALATFLLLAVACDGTNFRFVT